MRRREGPPVLATWLLELVLPPGRSRDGLLGDMEERFHRRARESVRGASREYWAEAVGGVWRYALEGLRPPYSRKNGGRMDRLSWDLRYAVRSARQRPGFTALVVVTLSLGIGANAAVFSVVHTLLLRSLPYGTASERLVMADQLQPTGHRAAVSMPNYMDWRDGSRVFDGFAMEKPQSFRVGGESGAEVLEGRLVLGDFFELLDVTPSIGRLPSAEELGPGAERIVVLTHGLWMRRFAGRTDVVGDVMEIGGEPYEVVAVLPRGFALDREVALYVPLGLRAGDPVWQDRSTSYGGWVVARLRPGASLDEARADLSRVGRDIRAELGDDVAVPAAFSMREWYLGDVRRPVLYLMGGAALVLFVACANMATLLMGRGDSRRDELAVRSALGAGRYRILRQLLTEGLLLGLAGVAAGLLLARFALDALVAVMSSTLPAAFAERVEINLVVVAVSTAISLLVILFFALLPALSATRGVEAGSLRRSVGGRREGARLRGFLVAGEAALATVLLVSMGLLVRSVGNLRSIDTGFSPEGVLTQRLSAPGARYPDRESAYQVLERIRGEVERLPEVSHASLSNLFPFSRTNWEMLFRERSRGPDGEPESVLYTAATPDYFDVFSIRLLRGRLFTEEDRADAEPVVVIDESAAERYWPGGDPIGRQVAVDDVYDGEEYVPRWRRVVGVVEHVRNYELTEPSRIEAYVPLTQSPACCSTLWLSVRTDGDPAALAPLVRDVTRRTDPEIPVYRVNTLGEVLAGETAIHRAVRQLFLLFGAIALLLGVVGIYGVVASETGHRRREIGVRLTLGSTPGQVVRKVAGKGLGWVVAGLFVGLVGAALAGRILQDLLVEVSPAEPSILVVASAILVLSALLAAWLPARQAARVDPAEVLREE